MTFAQLAGLPSTLASESPDAEPQDAPSTCIGYPLITFVEQADTLDTLLSRVAPRIGEEVETLRTWVPRLVMGGKLVEWPKDSEGNGNHTGTALWMALEKGCPRLVNVAAFDVGAWQEVPSLIFLKSDPPLMMEPAKEGDGRGATRKGRRLDQGIKIREG